MVAKKRAAAKALEKKKNSIPKSGEIPKSPDDPIPGTVDEAGTSSPEAISTVTSDTNQAGSISRPNNAVSESSIVEILKDFDENKFKADLAASGKSESGARWKEFDNFWINIKLKPDTIFPGVANRGGSGPQRDDLQGARYIRATFVDGSKHHNRRFP